MRIIEKDEMESKKYEVVQKIRAGEVFIHPTDTIYGLGCNAKDSACVKKLRDIKQRADNPFSIIAPSKEWIKENCEVSLEGEVWLNKLPGPYTLIFKLKKNDAIAPETNVGGDTLGVRIPDHWSAELAAEAKVPIVTTSANVSGRDFMTSLDNLDPEIKGKIKFMINEGEIKGKPSTLVNLAEDDVQVKER